MSYIDDIFERGGAFDEKLPNYEVRPGQIELARAFDRAIRAQRPLMAEGPTGCHAPGQGILMFDGTTRLVEDVRVGDLLMGPDSRPREVMRLLHGVDEMVHINPVKGSTWCVNLQHILTLARTGTGELIDVSVWQWLGWSTTDKHLWKLARCGVNFPKWRGYDGSSALPLDPYFLGVLLGDGSLCRNGSVSVTKEDPEIQQLLQEQAALLGMVVRTRGDRGNQHHITAGPNAGSASNPVTFALRALGLWRADAGSKFIPWPYRVASREDRLKLLAGLMDTDGSYSNGCYDYVSKSSELVEGITFVARSLGFAAYPAPCTKRCQNDFEGEYHRVCLSGDLHSIPCRIPRKQAAPRQQTKSVLRTGFDVIRGREGFYYGFVVSGDGRYLLDDFTITHNCGKSFAYLVPSIYHSVVKKTGKAIIVTANIALQEQLVRKDLPFLKEVLPWTFTFGLAKGRNNYLCLSKRQEMEEKGTFDDDGLPTAIPGVKDDREIDELRGVWRWTFETSSGDKSDCPSGVSRVWWRLSSSHDDCLGNGCPRYTRCWANRARDRAMKSNVVVMNYHLRFIGGGAVTPEHAIMVCDEAHETAGIARDFLGWTLTVNQINRIATWLRKASWKNDEKGYAALSHHLRGLGDKLFSDVADLMGDKQIVRLYDPNWVDVGDIVPTLERVDKIAAGLAEELKAQIRSAGDEKAFEKLKKRKARAERMGENALTLACRIDSAVELGLDGWVLWLAQDIEKKRYTIEARPIEVADIISKMFYPAASHSVMLISATMTSGGSFNYVRDQLGVPEEAGETVAPSPFDLREQGLLFVPEEMSPPPKWGDRDGELAFQNDICFYSEELIQMCGGRCLLLFSSWKNLNYVHNYLSKLDLGVRVLKQGEKPRMKLVQEFKDDETSVLMGVASFWTGVDVPGRALSGLLIDKIPFGSPSDPVNKAVDELLKSRGKNVFMERAVPEATIKLRQGAGRLIRTRSDIGIVVITDTRLLTTGYGDGIVGSLPEFKKVRSLERAQEFAEELMGR